jgi:predicted ATPase
MKETKTKSTFKDDQNSKPEQGITKISVSGYKSLAEECSIEIAPLTILSGANSSGKSSIMQPLLLMKQTLESTYDAGSLKLNGANVRLTSTDQIFTKGINKPSFPVNTFSISLEFGCEKSFKNTFKKENKNKGIKIFSSVYKYENIDINLTLNMSHEDILTSLSNELYSLYQSKSTDDKIIFSDFDIEYDSEGVKISPSFYLRRFTDFPEKYFKLKQELLDLLSQDEVFKGDFEKNIREETSQKVIKEYYKLRVEEYRCFLYIGSLIFDSMVISNGNLLAFLGRGGLCKFIEIQIRQLIHVPGLRGNPERNYPVTAVGENFTGTFENYVASIIHHWKISKDKRLKQLGEALQILGLTWKVDTKQIDDTQVEVRVGRLKNKGNSQATDMVSIADVGFGLSQTLPVVVALLVAEPKQLVYLEQPEIHLHPRAQANLAQLLVDAANRGVRVVVETHSELLIRRVQSLIAEDKIAAEKVKLHWFSQDDNGFTKVTTAELDETGAFGDWPEDFSEISLQEESRYLDAAESKLMAV